MRNPAAQATVQRSGGAVSPANVHTGASQPEQRYAAQKQEQRVPVQSVPRQQWAARDEEPAVQAARNAAVHYATFDMEREKYPAAQAQGAGSVVKKSGPKIERIQRPAPEQQRVEEQRKTKYHDLTDFYK